MPLAINKLKKYAPLFILVALSLLLATGKYSYAVTDGIKLWAGYVLPSFLPYLFITALLSSLPATFSASKKLSPLTNKLFNANGCIAYAFFMSAISGYPVGAKVTADLKENGLLSENQSETSAILSSTSSPAFTIGVVGNLMFRSTLFGLLLYLVNITCAVITGMLFKARKKDNPDDEQNSLALPVAKNMPSFYDVTYSSVISVLVVGGIIAVFFVLTEILYSLNVLSPVISFLSYVFGSETTARAVCFGLFEFTRGLKVLGETSGLFTLPVASFLCGFAGASALIQSVAYLKKAKIKTARFFVAKIFHAVLSFIFALVISLFLRVF